MRPDLKDIRNNLEKSDMGKIQLTITNNFISSKDNNDEELVMQSKSDNTVIMINCKVGKVIEELFKLLVKKKSSWIGKITRGSYFIFDCVRLLYYKCHEINPNRGG